MASLSPCTPTQFVFVCCGLLDTALVANIPPTVFSSIQCFHANSISLLCAVPPSSGQSLNFCFSRVSSHWKLKRPSNSLFLPQFSLEKKLFFVFHSRPRKKRSVLFLLLQSSLGVGCDCGVSSPFSFASLQYSVQNF